MTIDKKIGLGFGFALAVLVAIGFVTYRNTTRLVDTAHGVTHTYKVIASLEALEAGLMDEVSGNRGYALTGKAAFKQQYANGVAKLDATMEVLRTLTTNDPLQ